MAEGSEYAESVASVVVRFVCRVADTVAAAVDSQRLAVGATDEMRADESAERAAVAVHQEVAGSQAQVFDLVVVPSKLETQVLELFPCLPWLRRYQEWVELQLSVV